MKQLWRGAVAFAAVLLTAAARATQLLPTTHQLFVPYFLEREGFASDLLLHNQRYDQSIDLTVYVQGDGARRALTKMTLHEKETRAFSLAAVRSLDHPIGYGGLVIEYVGDVNAIDASVRIVHRRDRLLLNVGGVKPEFVLGTAYAAVIW